MIAFGDTPLDVIGAAFAREINAVTLADVAGAARRRIFVATDTVDVLDSLQKRMRPHVLLDAQSDVKPQTDQQCPELRRALADLVTLSRCTTLIGTRDSRCGPRAPGVLLCADATDGRHTTSFSTVAGAWTRQSASARFVSVCVRGCTAQSQQRSPARTRNHSLCYWEWRHTRNFGCQFGSSSWRTGSEAQCCNDNLCDECLYHLSGFVFDFFGSLPYRPLWRLLVPAAMGLAVVLYAAARCCGHPLAVLSVAALFSAAASVVLVLSINVLQHGHVLGAYRLLWS